MKSKQIYGNKKRNIIFTIFSIGVMVLGVFISSFAFLPKAVENTANSRGIVSIYNDTKYDYIITGLKDDNIAEVKSSSSIKEYVEFYNVISSINTHLGEADIYVRSLKEENKLYLTEYTNERIISSKDSSNNQAYLSESFARSYSMNIGDEIKIGGIDFTISRIYRNSSDSNIIYIPDFATKIYQKFSQSLTISGAYIECINKTKFLSDIDAISGINIHDKMAGFDEASAKSIELNASAIKGFTLFGVLAGSIFYVSLLGFLLIFRKKMRKEVVDGGKNRIVSRLLLGNLLGFVAGIISIFVALTICVNNCNMYVSFSTVISCSWSSFLINLGFVVLSLITYYLFIKTLYKNVKKKNKELNAVKKTNETATKETQNNVKSEVKK